MIWIQTWPVGFASWLESWSVRRLWNFTSWLESESCAAGSGKSSPFPGFQWPTGPFGAGYDCSCHPLFVTYRQPWETSPRCWRRCPNTRRNSARYVSMLSSTEPYAGLGSAQKTICIYVRSLWARAVTHRHSPGVSKVASLWETHQLGTGEMTTHECGWAFRGAADAWTWACVVDVKSVKHDQFF